MYGYFSKEYVISTPAKLKNYYDTTKLFGRKLTGLPGLPFLPEASSGPAWYGSGRLWNAKWATLEREVAEFKVQRCRVEGAKVPTSGCKGAELSNCGGRYTWLHRPPQLIVPPAQVKLTARSTPPFLSVLQKLQRTAGCGGLTELPCKDTKFSWQMQGKMLEFCLSWERAYV